MKREAYAAARTVSPALHAYFAHHRAEAIRRGQEHLAPLPEAETIEAVIDAAFWASLRREEGYVPRISLAFLSPEDAVHPLMFERPLPLDPSTLTRVAPAVERPGIHLGVWRDQSELCVWGTTRVIPTLSFVLEVAAPGLLVIKHHSGDESGKFVNIAVLEGDQIKVVDEHASTLPNCPAVLGSLLGYDSPTSWAASVNVLVQLAVSMRAHGRGGALLVVPHGSEAWRESIVRPVSYSIAPAYTELAKLMRVERAARAEQEWQDAFRQAVDVVGGLTAVDGAALIDCRHRSAPTAGSDRLLRRSHLELH